MNTQELVTRLANVQQAIATCEDCTIRDPYAMQYYTNQLLEEQLLLDELHTTKGWVHMYAMSRATELKERMFWVNRIHGRNTK